MDQQIIIVCNDVGTPTGEYVPKEVGHSGAGKRHLAITVLLFNSKHEVLLQRRKHKVFDDIWDFTGSTHPLHLADGRDETFTEATLRCLKNEYGIEGCDLKNLGTFNYFAQYKDGLCENEHCALMVGEYNGEFTLNESVGYECKWMDYQQFLQDLTDNPAKYSPWVIEALPLLKSWEFGQF